VGHVIVQGLMFGDEGKGTIVDAICARRSIEAVIRFNGGCQAGHNVVTNDGVSHIFSQFGAGTLQGVRTILTGDVLVDPLAIGTEAAHLVDLGVKEPLRYLTVDREALVVTPYHQHANRLRERVRGEGRHGSTGRGIGETVELATHHELTLRIGDLESEVLTRKRLEMISDHYRDEFGGKFAQDVPFEQLVALLTWFPGLVKIGSNFDLDYALARGDCVFEGAQGVLLDELWGFAPYNTWSSTTFQNALDVLMDAGNTRSVERVGVTRIYATRHGPGPFPTEDEGLASWLQDTTNKMDEWQGGFRVGHLDLVLLQYASRVCGGMDSVAVTHLDRATQSPGEELGNMLVCTEYEDRVRPDPWDSEITNAMFKAKPVLTAPVFGWPETIVQALGVPVSVESFGPRAGDKEFHQNL
jgi:adenylosuccinate synthase